MSTYDERDRALTALADARRLEPDISFNLRLGHKLEAERLAARARQLRDAAERRLR